MTRILIAGVVAIAFGVGLTRHFAVRAARPATVGLEDGALSPCGPKPNCASSINGGPCGDAKPLEYAGDRAAARRRLLAVLADVPHLRIETVTDDYVHATTRSSLFGFVDDLEFHLPESERIIHYRSAARWGHSDLGVNAARMARIRARFERAE